MHERLHHALRRDDLHGRALHEHRWCEHLDAYRALRLGRARDHPGERRCALRRHVGQGRAQARGAESTRASKDTGLEGDHYTKAGSRQITILSEEAWQNACNEIGQSLDFGLRRANLLFSGLNLVDSIGKRLQIGEIEVEILGETKPCRLMDETCPGLKRALSKEWRGGVFGKVINPGTLRVDDKVQWITS